MQILYFLTPEIEKVEMEFVTKRFLTVGLTYNESQYVKFRKGKGKWTETTLRAFNQTAQTKGWIASNKETMEMLGL